MNFYPAIDLKDGKCVRLMQGDMNAATVYGEEPGVQARSFVDAGCKWIHVVDLNGAFAGKAVNKDAVAGILTAAETVHVQLGGGIRDMAGVEQWLEYGVQRVILGTAAVKDPDFVKTACKSFPGQVAVGIDARGGMVAVEGWAETSDIAVVELAKRFEDAGVAAIVTTDIDRDGAMKGPNLIQTGKLAEAVSIPIILSGGIRSIEDLRAAALITPPIEGVISGKAIYEGGLDVSEAVQVLADMNH